MAAGIVQSLLCILIVAIAFSSGRSFSGCGGQRRRPIRICQSKSATETSLVRRDNESSGRWILLVEDEGDLRSAIGKYLAKEGCVVTGVSDARSAILVCRGIVRPRFKFDPSSNYLTTMPNNSTQIPDCVILDIQMAGSMNGLGLLKFIRSDPMLASLPVVLLTAKGKVEDRIVGYELGADAYLPKPFDPDELVSIVNGLLMRDKMTMGRDAGPSLNNKTTNNAVYGDLKRELKEIKALLSLDVHSPGKSEMSVDSLRCDILEIKDAIKGDLNQSTPSTKQDHERGDDESGDDEGGDERYNYESLSVLTPVETEVINLVARGLSNKDISKEMGCSVSKIEKLVTAMFKKANVNKRADLVSWWGEYSKAMENMGAQVDASGSRRAKEAPDAVTQEESRPSESPSLTTEERAVLELLERGLTTEEIISTTQSTKRRIADQLDNLFNKAQVKNRTELVRWWIEKGKGGAITSGLND